MDLHYPHLDQIQRRLPDGPDARGADPDQEPLTAARPIPDRGGFIARMENSLLGDVIGGIALFAIGFSAMLLALIWS